MKTDRFDFTLVIAAAVLAGLLTGVRPAAVLAIDSQEPVLIEPAAPQLDEPAPVYMLAFPLLPEAPALDEAPPEEPKLAPNVRPTFGRGLQLTIGRQLSGLATRLAGEVAQVRMRFIRNRRQLPAVRDSGGERAYPRQEVAGLILATWKDLDQAIQRAGEPGLVALRAWSAEEIRRVHGELAAAAGPSAASSSGLSGPRAVAVVASLGGLPLPGPPSHSAAAPARETIAARKTQRLLDQVGEVIGRILVLAERDDLEVKLWVGSTPAPQAMFFFWPQGRIRGSTPSPVIIRTGGRRDHVLRGLYFYRAAWDKGAVTEVVQYPSPAGASGAQLASERLDLVNGSSFFCCRFSEQYCHHVANEKECRP